jgi:hypothetical protein
VPWVDDSVLNHFGRNSRVGAIYNPSLLVVEVLSIFSSLRTDIEQRHLHLFSCSTGSTIPGSTVLLNLLGTLFYVQRAYIVKGELHAQVHKLGVETSYSVNTTPENSLKKVVQP